MGDRAVVVFTDDEGETYSPGVYLHWNGGQVPDLLKKALPRMRTGDAGYSAARFCGVAHENIEGALSLGLVDAPERDAGSKEFPWAEYSHGDAGVFLVDVNTWKVDVKEGYAQSFDLDPNLAAVA